MSIGTNLSSGIDKSWTLFLDRDGVINVEVPGNYVTNWSEFQFIDGVLEALPQLNELFGNIVMVTNQRGVGRGIMSIEDLREIHQKMTGKIKDNAGRIDRIYSCTAIEDNNHNRKPNTGMGLQAREDFPNIDFKKSIIVGNNISDMEFGKRLAMHTIFLTSVHAPYPMPHNLIDEQYDSLNNWVKTLETSPVFD